MYFQCLRGTKQALTCVDHDGGPSRVVPDGAEVAWRDRRRLDDGLRAGEATPEVEMKQEAAVSVCHAKHCAILMSPGMGDESYLGRTQGVRNEESLKMTQ